MVAASSTSVSRKEYLKKYENNNEEDQKKKKKKKKVKSVTTGVLVVDEDPIWQKPVKLVEEEEDSADEEKPQVDEDIEVKRMKRLEQLRARRPFGAISEDGSGWVSVFDAPKNPNDLNSDMSPPRKRSTRNDTPSPEPELMSPGISDTDLSPPRHRQKHYHCPSPEIETKPSHPSRSDPKMNSNDQNINIYPPRRRRARYDTPSPEPDLKQVESNREAADLSPPRQRRKRHHAPSPVPEMKTSHSGLDPDLSPSCQSRSQNLSKYEKNSKIRNLPDISPPRRLHRSSHYQNNSHATDLSPPGKSRMDTPGSPDVSPRKSSCHSTEIDASHISSVSDLSPPRKIRKESISLTERPKTGLVTGQDIKEEIAKTKKDDFLRFKDMDASMSGRGAEPVYRDKITGERLSKEQLLKSQKKEEKPKEIKLEWGKGLSQKREAEEKLQELELEKDKPFARTRDDPDLDRMLKERLRWGDPMAHLVKNKYSELILPNLGDGEKMKESGFIIPQEIPDHSWIKRGLEAAPNRYGIKPGRHWDGVDRSNGFEKQSFKRTNEKQAVEKEAYLWSVSDM